MRWSALCGATLLLALPAAGATHPGPVAVSPGSANELALVESRCPTFSWGSVAGALTFELVVYRLGDQGEPMDPELRQSFAGTVTSWTPALEQCLERGGHYAWTIRAATAGGDSEWSPAKLFEVADPPADIDLREAVVLVRRLLAAAAAAVGPVGPAEDQATAGGANPEPPASPGAGLPTRSSASEAALTIEGELRTVTSDGTPRLWGLGRPGTQRYGTASGMCELSGVFFGLSATMVPWWAAQHACPVGTWVCQSGDRGYTVCNTERPDDLVDGYGCDLAPLDWTEDAHRGWVDNTGDYSGTTRLEKGNSGNSPICSQYPVWCCSE